MTDKPHEWHRGGDTVSTDPSRLDLDIIHGFLTTSYWVPGIAREVVETAVQHSLCFGLYRSDAQLGFARVVTDYARFGYLLDVFVLEDCRGQGLGKWLISCILDCPSLSGLASIGLATRDAHELYETFGWQRLTVTDHLMMLRRFALAIALAVLIPAAGTHALDEDGSAEEKLSAAAANFRAQGSHEPDAVNLTLVGNLQLQDAPTGDGGAPTVDLYVAGNYAYVGSFSGVLHIVDISDPQNMRKVSEVPLAGPGVLDVKISGDLAAIGVQGPDWGGLVTIDISDPPNPRILTRMPFLEEGGVHNLFLYKDRAYLAHAAFDQGMTIVDLTDPAEPTVSGFWKNEAEGFSNVVHDVFIRDDLAFISDIVPGLGGLVILDLANPDNPVTLSSSPYPEGIHSAWMENGFVYFNQELSREFPLRLADVRDPRNPVDLGTFSAGAIPATAVLGSHNPWAQDGLLYWANYDSGLRIFDLARPDRPIEIASYVTPSAWGAQPHDDGLVYVSDFFSARLLALRFDEPSHRIDQVTLGAEFLLDERQEPVNVSLQVIAVPSVRDIDGRIDRVSARFLDDADVPAWPLFDDGEGRFGGQISIEPERPAGRYQLRVELHDDRGRLYPFEVPFEIFPARDQVIFADGIGENWQQGLLIGAEVDPDATDVVYEGQTSLEVEAAGLTVEFLPVKAVPSQCYKALRFAFHPGEAAAGFNPVFSLIVNANRSSASPFVRLLGGDLKGVDLERSEWQEVEVPMSAFFGPAGGTIESIRFIGSLRRTFFLDDIRLVTAAPFRPATAVLESHTSSTPDAFTLDQNYPNPFNPETTIRFDLPRPVEIDLSVYNLAGQRVATLAHGLRAAGAYAIRWDGNDDTGRALASGMYAYRLRTPGGLAQTRNQTRKLVLVR